MYFQASSYLSDIGGVLGLWVGFSMLTIAEFLEFGLDLTVLSVTTCFQSQRTRKRVHNKVVDNPGSGRQSEAVTGDAHDRKVVDDVTSQALTTDDKDKGQPGSGQHPPVITLKTPNDDQNKDNQSADVPSESHLSSVYTDIEVFDII